MRISKEVSYSFVDGSASDVQLDQRTIWGLIWEAPLVPRIIAVLSEVRLAGHSYPKPTSSVSRSVAN